MKLFYEIAFKAVIRAVLSPLTPTHTFHKPPFHFDNFRTGKLCYEAEKATNSVFLPCCLQNGGDGLQNQVSCREKRATDSRTCTWVMSLWLLRCSCHFTRGDHCWDPAWTFCKHLKAQKSSADDRSVTGWLHVKSCTTAIHSNSFRSVHVCIYI